MRGTKQYTKANAAITAAFEPLIADAVKDQPGAQAALERGLLPHWDGKLEINLVTGETTYHPGKFLVR